MEPEGIDFKEVTKVSDEVTEVLMYTPGEFWVKQIVRPKYKAKKETQDLRTVFYQHPILPSILPGCMAGNPCKSPVLLKRSSIPQFSAVGLCLSFVIVSWGSAWVAVFLIPLQLYCRLFGLGRG